MAEKQQTNDSGNGGEPFKRWTAKRKAAVVLDLIKGKTTPAEIARHAPSKLRDPVLGLAQAARPVTQADAMPALRPIALQSGCPRRPMRSAM